MKKLLAFLIVLSFIQSCSIKENIYDTQAKKYIGGYNKGELRIGKTEKDNVSPDSIKTWKSNGVFLRFDNNSNLLYSIEVRSTTRYKTRKNVRVGDDLSKVEKVYGKPLMREIDYGQGNSSIHWLWKGLFYKNKSFFTDSTGTSVVAFCVGNPFKL